MMLLPEISAYIIANATGFSSTNLFLHQYHSGAPDTLVVLRESGGAPPTYDFNGVTFERPSFQVVTRAAAYTTARTNANRIYTLLSSVENSTLSGTYYNRITPNQSPFDVGEESDERALVSCNYLAEKEISAS